MRACADFLALIFIRWHVSRIVDVDAQEKRALVHFIGWKATFDTWISFDNLKEERETKKELAQTPQPARIIVASVHEDRAELSVVVDEGVSKGDGSKELQQYQFRVDGELRPVQRFLPSVKSKGRGAAGGVAETWTCILEDPFDEPAEAVSVSVRIKAARHAFCDWLHPIELRPPPSASSAISDDEEAKVGC